MKGVVGNAVDASHQVGRPRRVRPRRTMLLLIVLVGLFLIWLLADVLRVGEVRRVAIIPYNGGFEGPQRYQITRNLYLYWGGESHELLRWTAVGE